MDAEVLTWRKDELLVRSLSWAEKGMFETAYLARHCDEGVGLCSRLEGNKKWRCVMSSGFWALEKWRALVEWRGGLQSRSGLAYDRLCDGCEMFICPVESFVNCD